MTELGNLFLIVATLIFFALSPLLFSRKPAPRGDYGVGHAWTMILGNAGFILCLGIVTAIIGWKGGFDWVDQAGGQRFLIVSLGFVLAMTGYFFFSMKEGFGQLPPFLKQLTAYLPGILPVFLLASAAILLNDPLRAAVPAPVYKWPIYFVLATGIPPVGMILAARARNVEATVQAATESEQRNHQDHLDRIDSTDANQGIAAILVFTDSNHNKVVRQRALAKVKSRADWQEELIRLLQTGWAPEVFTFLASNEVDDQNLFAEPLEAGIRTQARLIRESIRRCRDKYDLYEGRFIWEVDRVLRTVQKFNGAGVDYRPAVQELRKALDERTHFEKPTLRAIHVLEKWLKKH
ncbi:MAG TPA: hypothetical protein PKE06_15160 [Flavilitoribacter sp.]|nr:hypothetical protein [Flavilitoribacter sp.]